MIARNHRTERKILDQEIAALFFRIIDSMREQGVLRELLREKRRKRAALDAVPRGKRIDRRAA